MVSKRVPVCTLTSVQVHAFRALSSLPSIPCPLFLVPMWAHTVVSLALPPNCVQSEGIPFKPMAMQSLPMAMQSLPFSGECPGTLLGVQLNAAVHLWHTGVSSMLSFRSQALLVYSSVLLAIHYQGYRGPLLASFQDPRFLRKVATGGRL